MRILMSASKVGMRLSGGMGTIGGRGDEEILWMLIGLIFSERSILEFGRETWMGAGEARVSVGALECSLRGALECSLRGAIECSLRGAIECSLRGALEWSLCCALEWSLLIRGGSGGSGGYACSAWFSSSEYSSSWSPPMNAASALASSLPLFKPSSMPNL